MEFMWKASPPNILKSLWHKFENSLGELSLKYPKTFLVSELTILYVFAITNLIQGISGFLGFIPASFYQTIPFASVLFNLPVSKFLLTPEKIIGIYLITFEALLHRPSISLIFKYNLFLVFIIEMFQNLIMNYWDLFAYKDISLFGTLLYSKESTTVFFIAFFLFFLTLYVYCYLYALSMRLIVFPKPLNIISDSAAFWLHIRTSTTDSHLKKEK